MLRVTEMKDLLLFHCSNNRVPYSFPVASGPANGIEWKVFEKTNPRLECQGVDSWKSD
jgi:hypothetical protein